MDRGHSEASLSSPSLSNSHLMQRKYLLQICLSFPKLQIFNTCKLQLDSQHTTENIVPSSFLPSSHIPDSLSQYQCSISRSPLVQPTGLQGKTVANLIPKACALSEAADWNTLSPDFVELWGWGFCDVFGIFFITNVIM